MTDTCLNTGTYLLWGSVRIVNGMVRKFEETPFMDKSGTDAIGVTYTIEYQGFIQTGNDSEASVYANQLNLFASTSAPGKLNDIKSSVWLPRQTLVLVWGGTTLLNVKSNYGEQQQPFSNGALDINNGPKCLSFRVDQMFGRSSAQVTITVQCTILPCSGPLQALNNRWSISEKYDADWRRTYTVRGVVRVGHVLNWDNAIKTLGLPPALPGFKLESMDFARSTTGLELTYEIAFKQMWSAPPYPASSWHCTVSESIDIGGARSNMQFNCSLTGYMGATKGDLFIIAINTFLLRLGTQESGDRGNRQYLIQNSQVVDHLHSNQLDVSIVVRRFWDPDDDGGFNNHRRWLGMLWKDLGLLPPLDLQNGSVRNDDGTAPNSDRWLLPDLAQFTDAIPSLFYQKFNQNPCDGAVGFFGQVVPLDPLKPLPTEDPPNVSQTTYPQTTSPGDDSANNQVSQAQKVDFFTEIKLHNRYMVDHGRTHLPLSYRAKNTDVACVIRRVHQPKAVRVVYYDASRLNQHPSIPPVPDSFTDANGIKCYLDEEEVIPYPPFLSPDGTQYVYRIELRLTYLMSRPINRDEKLQPGSLPWDLTELASTGIALNDLVDETINDGSA